MTPRPSNGSSERNCSLEGGEFVMLSLWSAERLGVELIDPLDNGLTHWDTPDLRKRTPVRIKQTQAATDELDLFGVVDTAPGPLETLLMTEAWDTERNAPVLDAARASRRWSRSRPSGGMTIPIEEQRKRKGS
jgi:hypothetical protein